MFPPSTVAASLVPSLEEVMQYQVFVTPTPAGSRSVQVAPESLEVQMFPTYSTAASLVPSLEEVIQCQFCPGQRAFVGAIAINVRNKVKNKRYLLDAVRGAPGTNAYARMLP